MIRNIFLLSILAITACNSRLETVNTQDEYGYTEVYQRDKEDYGKEGVYERYNEKNIKVEEAVYRNDTLSGYRILYYENGDTQVVENYVDGHFDGVFQAYYENGQLEINGTYNDNTMDGPWKRYYQNGQLMEIVTFRNNEENGPFTEYHENGKLKAEGSYLNGDNEHGELKLYDESGELIRKMNCENGICRTVWSRESSENETSNE